jgi:hypothetical protein
MFNSQVLRRWLADNNRSALWLARTAKIGEATVYRLLGKPPRKPHAKVLLAISRVTGLSFDDLLVPVDTPAEGAA